MNYKPILIVAGEPNSIFLEIFFKSLKSKKYQSPLILICSKKLLIKQMKKFKFKKKLNLIDSININKKKLTKDTINLIDIELDTKLTSKKNFINSQSYIKKCFEVAFKLINKKVTNKFINGPISKDKFLNKKFLGMTEYIANEFKVKTNAMLIYNKSLSVCPVTTHLPLKSVATNINKRSIVEKIKLIENFYKKDLKIKPKIAVLGLNPHCESIDKFNEDKKILKPAINLLNKKGIKISGPYPADTIFLKNNRQKFNVIVGMYHDQVLTPLKTLYEYDAINITLGLPFIRISPDHGPNEKMVGKNISNPQSLIKALKFLDKN
jgi:4-hydroxythreonine-4-phosphate dehydrogenase